jgi:hypothetical protein
VLSTWGHVSSMMQDGQFDGKYVSYLQFKKE